MGCLNMGILHFVRLHIYENKNIRTNFCRRVCILVCFGCTDGNNSCNGEADINELEVELNNEIENANDEPTPDMALDETSEHAIIQYNDLEAENIVRFGDYDWRVLDIQDGRALLLSEYIVVRREYHGVREYITWAESDLRAYLNSEFYNSFSEADRMRIVETVIMSDDRIGYDDDGWIYGDDTVDKIFLLSMDEIEQYFDGTFDEVNILFPDRMAYDLEGSIDKWWLRTMPCGWLRSPGFIGYDMVVVDISGDIISGGLDESNGLRPALWLNLN